MLAVEIKRKAPSAHTVLEIVKARWGRTAHKVPTPRVHTIVHTIAYPLLRLATVKATSCICDVRCLHFLSTMVLICISNIFVQTHCGDNHVLYSVLPNCPNHVQAARLAGPISILAHTVHKTSYGKLRLLMTPAMACMPRLMLEPAASAQCYYHAHGVHADLLCCNVFETNKNLHMLHAHAACTCRMHMPHAHAAETDRHHRCLETSAWTYARHACFRQVHYRQLV